MLIELKKKLLMMVYYILNAYQIMKHSPSLIILYKTRQKRNRSPEMTIKPNLSTPVGKTRRNGHLKHQK